MRTVRVARELDIIGTRQLQDLLEFSANIQQDVSTLIHRSAFAACDVAVATARDALADSAGPDTDTIEALSHVDDNTHDLAVAFLLKGLADSGKHDMQPELVNRNAFILEGEGPFPSMFILLVLPLGSHTFLEEVVVRFLGEFGDRCDVVLDLSRLLGPSH